MGKYIPSFNYWLYYVVVLIIFLFPIELFKNNRLDYFLKQFNENINSHLKINLNHYEDLAKFIYLNDIKLHEDLISVEKEELSENNSKLASKIYYLDFKSNLFIFNFLENKDSKEYLSKVNFNLESFLHKLNKNNSFTFKKIDDYNKFLGTLKTTNINKNFVFFKDKNYKYLGMPIKIANVDFFVYMNIDNSHLTSINKNFSFLYVFIILIVSFIFLLIFNLNRYRKNLKNFTHHYDELMEAIDRHILMIKINKNNKIIFATEALCQWSGYFKIELIDEDFDKLIHDDVSENFFKRIKSTLDTTNYWEGEFKNKDRYGNSLWTKGVIFPVYDEHDNLNAYTLILADISDNRQMSKINNLLKEELSNKLNEIKIKEDDFKHKTKVQLMSRVLDSISHQWKEPIANISVDLTRFSVYLIEHSLFNQELGKIHKNIDNELKNLSISLNKFKSMFVKEGISDNYNVYSVIKDAISICQNDISHYNLKVSLDASKDIYGHGISSEIRYIILSLLKHTIKKVKINNIDDCSVNFTVFNDHDDVLIKYSDNTQSFSNEIISEIFEQKDEDLVAKDLDTNLHVVKLLIEKTGSKIWFENNNGNTVFYLKLISKNKKNSEDKK